MTAPARRPALVTSTTGAKRAQDVFSAGDPALEKKARRGRLPVERVVDLHGLTQRAAHATLVRFLTEARADGLRCVLVITGKGADTRIDPFTERSSRGVIRTRFRDWVNKRALKDMIARVAPAHPRDGGSGAFYVFLKRGIRRGVS